MASPNTVERLTLPEVAAELKVTVRFVRGLLRSGRLRHVRVSPKVRFVERGDLERFLKTCKKAGAA